MPRVKKSFIEMRAEKLARAGVQMEVGDSTVSSAPSDNYDYNVDTVDIDDPVLKQTRRVPIETIASDNIAVLWTKVYNTEYPNTFKPRPVPTGMVDACLKKKDDKGRKAFWQQEHLPPGWVPFTSDNFEFECYQENCGKRVPNAQALAMHMQGWHSEAYDLFKDELIEEVKLYAKRLKDKRNKRKADLEKAELSETNAA